MRNLAIDAWSGSDTARACSNDPNEEGIPCFHHEGELFSTTVDDVLKHVGRWLTDPETQNEVLLIWIEDTFGSDHSRTLFFNEFVQYIDKDYPDTSKPLTGDLIFGPALKQAFFPSQWPTPRQLVAMGKRVIVSVKHSSHYTSISAGGQQVSQLVFSESEVDKPGWPNNGKFTGYYACSYEGNASALGLDWTEFSELKITDHFELPQPALAWNELDVAGAVACGFSVTLDHVEADPDREAENGYNYYNSTMGPAIWSFSEGEPNNTGGTEHCAELMAGTGRWNDLACDVTRKYACRKTSSTEYGPNSPYDSTFWHVTSTSGSWWGGFTACPAGYSFLPPVNGWEAKKLANVISGTQNSVWINFTDRYQEGTWVIDGYNNWSTGEPNNSGGNEHCVEMTPTGTWNDTPCSDIRRHACERLEACASGACPAKWVLSPVGSWWWQNCPVGYTFSAPENPTENAELFAVAGGERVWLNRSNNVSGGRWAPGAYTAWDSTEPNNFNGNEHCAAMIADGTWWDQTCGTTHKRACRKANTACTTSGCPSNLWALSSFPGAWDPSTSGGTCPTGYEFKAPRNEAENTALMNTAAGQQVWLNYADLGHEGTWSSWGVN
ncbi:hypothetical protein FJV41_26115 [Myxococcus llanfairpwllgwyngyllgogerychwyrndrobwllllantysiliogogogochensis]|uniref:C-type lectin domain-containing protein n=1 Tax=Myxococcus llanfairpwllgwyngyllgogerychwyrndrobwllllantysiliogogogochensis TaxID=2590453 RepID=A0A540WVH9_9BACT|nr:lectin-like protein [Myxococcus llanfairpwllgwyngyllgogerychwyrndrobwllllantysiliogogogochensis]TQF13006.1 hypothetical protein FJV41_26115 [Myxococcus llanfairpwllgwyngyllgogerychwyrndrobwllllantysiliogogogochensis]